MIGKIYKEAFDVLRRKPIKLWGISLLSGIISVALCLLFGLVIGVAIALILLLSTGMTMVYLHGFRGEEVRPVQLFDCFKDLATVKRVVCGMAWKFMWIVIWGLIPIVGIIFAIRKVYAWHLVAYILVQEPDVPPTEAIHVSEQRTNGYKLQMFGADIIAFGIFVLASAVLGLLALIPYVGIVFTILSAIVAVLWGLFGNLFLGLVASGFYEEITGTGKNTDDAVTGMPAEEKPVAFCTSCGAKHEIGVKTCPACGAAIEDD